MNKKQIIKKNCNEEPNIDIEYFLGDNWHVEYFLKKQWIMPSTLPIKLIMTKNRKPEEDLNDAHEISLLKLYPLSPVQKRN